MFEQSFTETDPFPGVGQRALVGRARHADALRADADAAALEIHQRDPVTLALCADQVIYRHTAIPEKYRRGIRGVLPHFVLHPADLVTGIIGRNNKRANALFTRLRIGYREHDRNIRVGARSDKSLAAIQQVSVIMFDRSGFQRRGVRTGM